MESLETRSPPMFLIGYVNNIPTMQFVTGISRNTLSKSYMLSLTETSIVSGNSEIMHCGTPINMPYCVVVLRSVGWAIIIIMGFPYLRID